MSWTGLKVEPALRFRPSVEPFAPRSAFVMFQVARMLGPAPPLCTPRMNWYVALSCTPPPIGYDASALTSGRYPYSRWQYVAPSNAYVSLVGSPLPVAPAVRDPPA